MALREPLSGINQNVFTQLLAQTEALMMGDPNGTILDRNAPMREQHLPGNKPSTTVLMKELSPHCVGQLLALYEHIAYVQSVVWNLNPFSHWGTELSKRYSNSFANEASTELDKQNHDDSTMGLLRQYSLWSREASNSQQNSLEQEMEENSYPFF